MHSATPLPGTIAPSTRRSQHAPSAPRRPLWLELALIAAGVLVGLGLIAAVCVGLYRQFYSPAAFVERFVQLLADEKAAEALLVPGVSLNSAALESAGLSANASEALLRQDALTDITDIRRVSEESAGEVTRVTVSYRAAGHAGSSTFEVRRDGWNGVTPRWRFAASPLAVIELTVTGSMQFEVNGFMVDKRQVSPDGPEADPDEAVNLLVFSPGLYSVTVDTQISATPGVAVLSDSPLTGIPVSLRAAPTEEFLDVVQSEVDAFLTSCTQQQVLHPTGCPFGVDVSDRVIEPPVWTIPALPTVRVVPDGAAWRIPTTEATAHLEVVTQSLYDGSVETAVADVAFVLDGAINVETDPVSITIGGRPILD